MVIRFRMIQYVYAVMLTLFIAFPCQASGDKSFSLSTEPDSILMGAQFDGTTLRVSGSVPAESAVVVRFTGEPADLHLREKGKIFNLLWMNVGTVKVKNVPKVCIIDTSQTFTAIGPAAYPYSLAGLARNIEVEQEGDAKGIDVEKELILLKKDEGLYHESEQGVILAPEKNGRSEFSTMLRVPSSLAPGKYLVDAVAIKDGNVISAATKTVEAKMVGFPMWLSNLAFQKSMIYGVMATAIALVSGLLIGLVFQSKGAH